MHKKYYDMFRLENFWLRLSLHAADKEKFITNEEQWQFAEGLVRQVLIDMKLPFKERTGEAAFYGPKIDYQVTNVIGREETASTGQLDFVAADRFDLEYVASDGTRQRPWIIHRAPLGTHERFVAFLLEHLGGAFPTWMSPLQVMIIPVAPAFFDYARRVQNQLHDDLLRVRVDDSDDSFGKKIRNAATHKTPNLWIVGQKEMETESITWRRRGHEAQPNVALGAAHAALRELRARRIMDNFPDVAVAGWATT